MNTQLTTSELNSFESILPPEHPAQDAIATVVVLYILKIGLNIFCQYTEPPDSKSLPGE
ncbi:MAG: hypothetical protein RID09_31905 [Coleofasciculus sp. G1-WW12-02]|uniref:hypothetical protein n=1 Tax=Coleofasciculus sp. G1-WW12-02 TaxID=3068483 RepID=UPI0032FC76D1